MKNRITDYINGVFAPFDNTKSVSELKSDLLADLHDRFDELRSEGKDDETAFKMTVESVGDIEDTIMDIARSSAVLERKIIVDFSGRDISQTDLANVVAHESNFSGSNIKDSDFQGADLTGSRFYASDLQGSNFTKANLTDCNFKCVDLNNAIFNKTILLRTVFVTLGLESVQFTNVTFQNAKFNMCDLRKAAFVDCCFNGVDFNKSDLRDMCFAGITFTDVKFDKSTLKGASFKGSILKNVSFLSGFAFTNKYYHDVQLINFTGAFMDKITYASLKGIGANLDEVTVVANC